MPLCRRSYQAAYAARVDEDIDPYRFAPVGAGEYVEHITFSNFYNIYYFYIFYNKYCTHVLKSPQTLANTGLA